MADFVERHQQWLEQRKTRCAYGICGNKPVVEFNGKGYCRRCIRYARAWEQKRAKRVLELCAPDLLDALKDALAFLDRANITADEWYKLAPEHVAKFRQVIAKAEGSNA